MAVNDLTDRIEKAMRVLNDLSVEAKKADRADIMYAANRAWHELFQARKADAIKAMHQKATRP